jgi:hypothetical protein
VLRVLARRLWHVCFVVLLSLVAGSVSSHVVVPQPKSVKGESCVEPVDEMRRNHMRMLLHQRDDTVISGIRTREHSLVGCIGCHADTNDSGEYIRVDAPGQFCSTCHEYTAVKMDCFQCHAAVPPANDDTAQLEGIIEAHALVVGESLLPRLHSIGKPEPGHE